MDDKRGQNFQQKPANFFYCENCDYITSRKCNMDDHLMTSKHRRMTKEDKKTAKTSTRFGDDTIESFSCICGKKYKFRQGLWKHKQTCSYSKNIEINNYSVSDKEMCNMLLKQNNKLMKLLENGTTNISNNNNITNSHNKTFNLNVFLNETCKDAMNMSDFISSIKVNLDDLENTGKKGYIEGVSNIFVKNLNNLEQHMRPLHCSDLKREVLYIKDNDKWEKETDEKPILTKAIKMLANENIKQIKHWRDKYPDCTDSESKKNNTYLKIVSNSMNGLTEEEGKRNITKIISNVAKEVVIDKS